MRGDVPKVNYRFFCQNSIVREISEFLYGKYAVLIHVVCDLVNTGNDTDNFPNIIENDETEIILLRSIFSSGKKLEKKSIRLIARNKR